ncbi:type II toxin-antitoxin system VapC family toxin [Salinibacter altiplanensis]|uniref:type II toxin-antitoxin system VapC family toxin n=1 Tax=Salinibacter altiplanensis TaxID=1803181 RepID=UPI000C9FB211|nr:type II toxin-antitoxin system VapC family toxin [Salinibacter altiplanensis]
MIRYLLDTNVASEPVKPDPSDAVLGRLRERGGEVALPSVAWHELTYGAQRMDEGKGRDYLFEYLRDVLRPSMPILPYDAAAAQWHGWARAALEQKGRPTPFADGQIAAIAATEDLTVVTQNVGDFEPFGKLEEGIRVENWFSG